MPKIRIFLLILNLIENLNLKNELFVYDIAQLLKVAKLGIIS